MPPLSAPLCTLSSALSSSRQQILLCQIDHLVAAAAHDGADQPDNAPRTPKLVLGFMAEPEGELTRLITETRVHCPDRTSFLMFLPYWLVIRPASGLIRRRMLGTIKAIAEQREPRSPV